ncbi:flavin reductase family protein [Nocardioides mangrovicus]|uniref:Flavin reductase family protein n=1 Tax=Nocardioides mangrovicus TaxID=2478913 RepID=A0A3L8P0E9_9ACTN|nr:flavin reductase family protein [Nocardioides mangrovicus]RLV48664.1 flavin reductase family protein [Nocardioides mangrovicus]
MARRVFDLADDDVDAYPLLNSLVVPRPIAWVSTLDAEGRGNLAPHSFFSVASADPPALMFTSVGEKDTLRNVRATGEFVVSIASADLLDLVNDSSAPFEPGVDEAGELGIALAASEMVAPPRVADSPASLECRLLEVVPVGSSAVVIGQVLAVTVDDAALDGDHPMMDELRPLSRLGRNEWGRPPEVFALDRPRTTDDVRRSRS